jgi:solute carrier family 25 carnitine/acylcarnitine transporter 20/29
VFALYKGFTAPLVNSMVLNSLVFGSEENIRKWLFSNTSDRCSIPTSQYAVSGAFTGLIASFFLSPVELIKIKMQSSNSKYSNSWACFKDICQTGHQNNSFRNITRGIYLTIIREVPATSAYFYTYELMCGSLQRQRDKVPIFGLLIAGGLAGCISWMVVYPVDVIKSRYQLDFAHSSALECFRKSLRQEGRAILWRGLAPTLLRFFYYKAFFLLKLYFLKLKL